MGFGSLLDDREEADESNLLARVEPEELIQYGLIPELIGRLPVVGILHPFSDQALMDILLKTAKRTRQAVPKAV